MKKLLFAALAVAAIASCTKNDVRETAEDVQINFQAVVGSNSTKALINGNVYEKNAPSFGTVAFYNKSGVTFPGTGTDAAQLYIPLSEVKWGTNNRWSTEIPYYWPKGGGTLSFFSYSPYEYQETGGGKISATIPDLTEGLVFENYDVDAHQQTDLMVAEVVTGKTANDTEYKYDTGTEDKYNGVATVFRHKLAQVVGFVLKTNDNYDPDPLTDAVGDVKFTMNMIEFVDISYKGTYTGKITESDTDAWVENDTDRKEYVWDDDDHVFSSTTGIIIDTPTIANGYLLVLPQTFTDGKEKIRVTYTVSTYNGAAWVDDVVVTTVDLYDIHGPGNPKWEMNKKITYTLTFGLDQIYWSPSVEEWVPESFNYTQKI